MLEAATGMGIRRKGGRHWIVVDESSWRRAEFSGVLV